MAETDVHVAGLSGSLRDGSYTRAATDQVLAAAAEAGATTDCIDLRALELPVFDADDRSIGDSATLKRRIRRADAVALGTPVYHGSYSGAIRNALDYCGFEEFEHTTCGLVAIAGGSLPGGVFEHLTAVCHTLNAWVIPRFAAVPKASDRIDDGTVVDQATADRLADLGANLVEYAALTSPDR